jgi:hypothetical protein
MKNTVVLSLISLLLLPLAASAGVIYDTLNIAYNQLYDTANGDAWAGKGVFGALYDLMVADDIRGSGGFITHVAGAYVTFMGGNPADGLYVATFKDTGGGGPNNAVYQDGFFASSATSFRDTVFGLLGVVVSADIKIGAMDCPDGLFWITIQPKDLTQNGDWYYIVRDLNSTIGQDAYLRDGGRASGGYGFTTWTSAGRAGFGVGDSAIQVSCEIPEPATLSLLGLAALPFIRRKK